MSQTKSDLYQELHATVAKAIGAACRKWTYVDRGDMESAAWIFAIEAMARFNPELGVPAKNYITSVLARALPNEVRRCLSAVTLRRNHEYKVNVADVIPVAFDPTLDEALFGVPESMEDAYFRHERAVQVRQAAEEVESDPRLREALLSEERGPLVKLVRDHGRHKNYWCERMVESRARLKQKLISLNLHCA
jgi:hypothetical protein